MGKRVRVLTKCGEERFYDFDQEVDLVEIIEEAPKTVKKTTLAEISKTLADFVDKTHSWVVNLHLTEECGFKGLWGTQNYGLVITLNNEAKEIFRDVGRN